MVKSNQMDASNLLKIMGVSFDYYSGEIWKDNTSDVIYLYVGKDSKGKDVIIDLGGRYSYTGLIERCIVNSLKEQDGNIYIHKNYCNLNVSNNLGTFVSTLLSL